ncbi:MAG: substrate-binding domain-containing protein [Lachnospiraceae bacterium]
MNKRFIKIVFLMVSTLFLLTGCNQTKGAGGEEKQNVEGLKELGMIRVVSREEGSGTRSTFANLAGFEADNEGADTQLDLTRDDAVIANDSSQVIDEIIANQSAIGYVSGGALSGNENVKILNIEGKTPENNDAYPLSRDFYLAYSGKLSDLEQDFLTYIHGAGQEIVGKDYETVAKSSSFLSNQAEGEIKIEGSTSVAPLMEELAQAYEKINTHATVIVLATDSTKGLTQVMAGKCSFGMSSRSLKDYEKELLDYETIARDNIVVIVEKDNPLDDITLNQLKDIYTGDIKNWDELNEQ